ncbi:MAG TPA: amino acid permease, partial [Acidimicrobiia bacterium]|nr:amino acid permease [Acidimicrobiia bacterium]
MDRSATGGNLGTFVGVFMPSILTILGIILFLRLGYVVGNAGLRNALVIIGIATAVSVLTSISLAAIATNIEVRGGGDYYLISRTLGIEFGGAIGIVLFLAQAVSVAFYAIGFGEAFAAVLGWEHAAGPQIIAAVAVLALFVLAWLGADAASRFQTIVMVVLVAALVSIYVGAFNKVDGGLLADSWSAPDGSLAFWATFAIFFPAVTGFTQGVSMSGDLRSPGRSLPRGTFAAVGLSTVVYVSLAILLAATVPLQTLIDDTGALGSVASLGFLVDAGVIAATLSSAMASFLGAPRILQSLASDRVFPVLHPFAKGHGPTSNPRRGVLLSLAIALITISLGNLNVIAPVVSMFFLISYGLLNYATYYEANAASPSFRPRFRFFNRRLSLLGAIACLGAMLAINPVAGLAAVIVMFGIHAYLARRPHPERWVDAAHSHYFQRAKQSIRQMGNETTNSRNWRPQVLAFSADSARRLRLMRFAAWLEGASGLSAVAQVVQGSGALKRQERAEVQEAMRAEASTEGLDVHCLAVLAPDAMEALPIIVQSFGVGPINANTVLFGWPEHADPRGVGDYRRLLREVMRLGKNVVAVTTDPARWAALDDVQPKRRSIAVWWKGDDASRLALLAAYLFTRTDQWHRSG